uniref:Gibberellic acid methyltransferase n=1 Tax=Gnetum montanum TaxID=3381 RepID=A0A894T901_9SPER|nr:gibberellic acid methyltransferase [Gnetum montanum]
MASTECCIATLCEHKAGAPWKREELELQLQMIMCMQGGDGDGSYARNSEAPASAIDICRPLLEEAINAIPLCRFVSHSCLHIADLGCATGANTLATVDLVIRCISQRFRHDTHDPPEFEASFSDLPSNDFNSLFRSLPPPHRPYFAAGVPGSFYHRLFSRGKLHVAVSLSALHWMSRVPKSVLDKRNPAWNGGRAWIDGAKPEVAAAFAKQAEEDLHEFLLCRADEMASGGLLFLLMAARPDSDHHHPGRQLGDDVSRAKHPFTTCMDLAWSDLVRDGLIEEGTRDEFNVPVYMRSMDEVRRGFDACAHLFEVQKMEYMRVPEHSQEKQDAYAGDPAAYGRSKANLVRATLRPLIESHLRSPVLCDEFFHRFETHASLSHDPSLRHRNCFYDVLVVSAIRK